MGSCLSDLCDYDEKIIINNTAHKSKPHNNYSDINFDKLFTIEQSDNLFNIEQSDNSFIINNDIKNNYIESDNIGVPINIDDLLECWNIDIEKKFNINMIKAENGYISDSDMSIVINEAGTESSDIDATYNDFTNGDIYKISDNYINVNKNYSDSDIDETDMVFV
jgi:hypothetical protein